ncbi:hypothetical protein ACFOGJ_04550 [Marinibaculum pumilum]|uniref:Cytochrome c domain-containing protein n=1 Tax=Marinibaculum pumilum TaxID=1766165 RepID=A0ABV7KVQ7_9PROT
MAGRAGPLSAAAILLCGIVAATETAGGPPEVHDRRWLPPDSRLVQDALPPERLTVAAGAHGLVELGRLAFRSPEILGGNARLSGIACQTCHGNGGANADLFIPGLSDRPGRVDVAHRLWNPMADDGVDRPLEIPSLQGVADNAPYGTAVRMGSLRDFTRRVIVVEFAGREPRPDLLDALVEYQLALAAPGADAVSETARDEGAADLPRYLAVLRRALEAEDAPLADLVSRMVRAALGRMAARPAADALPYADWARTVAAVARQAEAGDFAPARDTLAGFSAAVAAAPAANGG